MDGLSRCPPAVNAEFLDEPKAMSFEYPDQLNEEPGWERHVPLELGEFAADIDTKGGYLQGVANNIMDFSQELARAAASEGTQMEASFEKLVVLQLNQQLLPEKEGALQEDYNEKRQTAKGVTLDNWLEYVRDWLRKPGSKPRKIKEGTYPQFLRYARQFFYGEKGQLYRRGKEGRH
ncbi:hypothetical protein C0992_003260, partial [Termitomyces sp. T32_za158]